MFLWTFQNVYAYQNNVCKSLRYFLIASKKPYEKMYTTLSSLNKNVFKITSNINWNKTSTPQKIKTSKYEKCCVTTSWIHQLYILSSYQQLFLMSIDEYFI